MPTVSEIKRSAEKNKDRATKNPENGNTTSDNAANDCRLLPINTKPDISQAIVEAVV